MSLVESENLKYIRVDVHTATSLKTGLLGIFHVVDKNVVRAALPSDNIDPHPAIGDPSSVIDEGIRAARTMKIPFVKVDHSLIEKIISAKRAAIHSA